ncbi:Cyclin-K isoform 1 [Balamuthia mandrillaris]
MQADALPVGEQDRIGQQRVVCAFMQEAGMKLKLPQLSIATAIVFFHRFYANCSWTEYDPYLIGTTCLFLAGKVEETPKKLRDVLLVTHHLRYKVELKPQAPESTKLREQILLYERIVLQNIAFNLTVEHPYKYLLSFVKSIQGDQNLAQVAWNFVNDSLRTTLCLQYEPKLIAIAAIYLASKFLNYKLPEADNKPWWEDLGFKIEDLDRMLFLSLLFSFSSLVDLLAPALLYSPLSLTNYLLHADVSNQILDLYDSQTPEGGGASSESGVNSDGPSEVNEVPHLFIF